MTRLKIAEERERDALQQRRRDKRAAAALEAANAALKPQEEERQEEEDLVEAAWVVNIQLQLSQLLHLDADDDEDQLGKSSSSLLDALLDALNNKDDARPS
jgi:hypothetical protein